DYPFSRLAQAFRCAQENRPLDLAVVDVRVGDRRADLSVALPGFPARVGERGPLRVAEPRPPDRAFARRSTDVGSKRPPSAKSLLRQECNGFRSWIFCGFDRGRLRAIRER